MLQIVFILILIILFLLAAIPRYLVIGNNPSLYHRIAFYVVSWRIRQVLPCVINYSKLNIRGAWLVRITFITGDCIVRK